MQTIKMTGIVTDVFPLELKGNDFSKRVFWLKEPDREQYPQHWELELHNDDTKRIDRLDVGLKVECEVELRGRKWDNGEKAKIFHTLKCVGFRPIK